MFVKFCQSLPFPVSMLHLHLNSAVLHHHVKTHQLPTLHHQLVALLLHHLPLVHHHDCTLSDHLVLGQLLALGGGLALEVSHLQQDDAGVGGHGQREQLHQLPYAVPCLLHLTHHG